MMQCYCWLVFTGVVIVLELTTNLGTADYESTVSAYTSASPLSLFAYRCRAISALSRTTITAV